jgi:lysophospholipase L1-like esterase
MPTSERSGAGLIAAAWVAPAFCVAGASLRQMLTAPEGTAPGVALAAIASGVWIVASFAPPVRSVLLEIGQILIRRVAFGVWLVASLLLLLLAATRGAFGVGVSVSAALLTWGSAREELHRDRGRFGFGLVLVGINAVLLVALNAFIGACVLPARSHNNIFTEFDALLGWKLRRGLSAERRKEAYTSRETINSLGFRTPEISFDKPPGVRRIVALGDSHTEGYTVNDDETYSALLQAELSASHPTQVVSLGVGGYSTDQELLAYLNVGRRYAPDVVLLQFCTNDLPYNVLDNYWRGRKPVFRRYGTTLMLTGVPVPNLRNTGLFGSKLVAHVSLFRFLEAELRQLAVQRDVEQQLDLEEPWIVTDLLLRDLDDVVRHDGARLAVLLADRTPETEAPLVRVLERRGIPYLDTKPAYVDDFDSYWVEGHWNQKGQRAIASVLAPPLRKLLDEVAASR